MSMPPCGGCLRPTCRLCYLARTDSVYRTKWGIGEQFDTKTLSQPIMQVSKSSPSTCRHLGEATGEMVVCLPCKGVEVKIFGCAAYGECTIAKEVGGVACCSGKKKPNREVTPCPGYSPSDPTESDSSEDLPLIQADGTLTPPKDGIPVLPNNLPFSPYHQIRRRRAVRWAYGITTIPTRKDSLLPRTIASLKEAGFASPHLFVDDETDHASWAKQYQLKVTVRGERIRTFGNWILSLGELYIRNPLCELYGMFQDDFVTYKGLKTYLENCPYPDKGYWNLYTFPTNEENAPKGYTGWYPSNQRGLGAVATVFDNDTVRRLLSHTHMVERPMHLDRGWKAVDGGIVSSILKMGGREYVHAPSLVQHTGLESSMGNSEHPLSTTFVGEDFDVSTLIR